VSVPFTVVIRTRSSAPPRATPPEAYCIRELPDKTLDEVKPLELFCKQITTLPNKHIKNCLFFLCLCWPLFFFLKLYK
jgi:hypothetical protein